MVRDANHALLMEGLHDLWSKSLGPNIDVATWVFLLLIRRGLAQTSGKGIVSCWDDIGKNMCWQIGNGRIVYFWKDNWIPTLGSLCDQVSSSDITSQIELSTCMFVESSGQWDTRYRGNFLPHSIIDKICSINLPLGSKGEDTADWNLSSDGEFSTKLAYESIIGCMSNVDIGK